MKESIYLDIEQFQRMTKIEIEFPAIASDIAIRWKDDGKTRALWSKTNIVKHVFTICCSPFIVHQPFDCSSPFVIQQQLLAVSCHDSENKVFYCHVVVIWLLLGTTVYT